MTTGAFLLIIIAIFIFGILTGIIVNIVNSKKVVVEDFCKTNYVFAKFENGDLSIDDACEKFKLIEF